MITYQTVETVVRHVAETSHLPYRSAELAPADRERLTLTAMQKGVSEEYILCSSRRHLMSDLESRREAHQVALLAREKGNPGVC